MKNMPWGHVGRVSSILIITAVIVAFRMVQTVGPERDPGDRFMVVDVIDGDTFLLAGGDRVRLLGIDTPEEGEPLHDEATAFLEQLILGRQVVLSFAGRRRDRYGRLLAFALVDDTMLINRRMLQAGLGYLYMYDEGIDARPEYGLMLQTQREAMQRRVGLAGLPWEPEEEYLAAAGSYRFHRPWCDMISPDGHTDYRHYKVRDSALWIGLSPCRDCRP